MSLEQVTTGKRQAVPSHGRCGTAAAAVRHRMPCVGRGVVGTYIANDIIRHGIDAVLRQLPSVCEVHHCASPEDVPAAAVEGRYDVLITADPGAAAAASDSTGDTRVLLLVDDADAEDLALDTPAADGFLLQQELTAERLRQALVSVYSGELVMPSSLARRLLARRTAANHAETTGRSRLTDRQLATLHLMADGLSNKQIARRLQISEHGAKRLVTTIMVKLDAPNRTSAVLAAMRRGFLPSPGHELAS
jgi:two-component system nitrate/nitrite response regulator NarL